MSATGPRNERHGTSGRFSLGHKRLKVLPPRREKPTFPLMYAVKEIYYTLQGEGAQAGRPAVFCRFAGCNLWSGREADRADALCNFCDTDFVGTDGPGGGKFETAEILAQACLTAWCGNSARGPSWS